MLETYTGKETKLLKEINFLSFKTLIIEEKSD